MIVNPRRVFHAGLEWGLIATLALVAAPRAEARTLYVRQSGDDASSGSSPAAAVRTIRRAAALALAGDSVLVGPGTYVEGDIKPTAFGHVRFVADRRGEWVGEAPGDVVIDATGRTTGFELNGQLSMTIDGFVIYGASIGIYVKSQSHGAVISNNVVCNNNTNGIYIQDSRDAVVFNNLVYNNGRSGILVTGNVSGSAAATIFNNTVYRNLNRGIYFAGTTVGSPGGTVLNNVVQDNAIAGIQVNVSSRAGYLSAGNVTFNNRFASGTPVDVTDIEADPAFVDVAGSDGILGGSGYADDRFHLSQRRAGQASTSPAVDAGSDLSRRLHLLGGSTRTDGKPDRGIADAGYHYGNFSSPPPAPRKRLRTKPLYVSSATGSDDNDGATRTTPVRTLAKAFSLVRPGHRVVLMGGTYGEGELRLTTSGLPERPIVVQGVNGAVIDASQGQAGLVLNAVGHLVLDGLTVRGAQQDGIEIRNGFGQAAETPQGQSSIALRRCRLAGNGRRGLSVRNTAGVLLASSIVENNAARGIQVEGAAMRIERSVVRNNLTGLWLFGGSSVEVSHTDFIDNAADGVLVEQSHLSIVGGQARGSRDGGIRFRSGSTGVVEEVTVADNRDIGIQAISALVTVIGGTVRRNSIGIQAFLDPVTRLPVDLSVEGTTVCDNGRDDSGGIGIDLHDATAAVKNAEICGNAQTGLRQRRGALDVSDSTIHGNRAGISSTEARRLTVAGATVRDSRGNGIQIVGGAQASVENSVLGNNSGDGLTIVDTAAPRIVNNLVHRNGSTGILVSGDTTGSPGAVILQNTIFANLNRGLLLGGSDAKPPSANATVMRNIFQANGNAGIQVNNLSLPGYVGNYNLSTDPYGPGTPVGLNDVLRDPLFVDAAAGDFRLQQTAAGQAATSPAVDAGGMSAAAAGMDRMTTRTDGVPDRGVVDIGYHYFP